MHVTKGQLVWFPLLHLLGDQLEKLVLQGFTVELLEEKPTALTGRERCMSVRPESGPKVMMFPGAAFCRDSAAAAFPSCFSAAAVYGSRCSAVREIYGQAG